MLPSQHDIEYISAEAIAFQKNSPLATALIRIFAAMRHDVDTSRDQIDSFLENDKRIKWLQDKFNDNYRRDVEAAVLEHLGIHIRINCVDIEEAEGLFAVSLQFNDVRAAAQAINNFTGVGAYRYNKRSPSYDDLVTMSDELDKDKVRIKRANFNDSKNTLKHTTVDVWFDVGCAFLAHELRPMKEGFEPEEITAIMLHELGHVFTTLERVGDMMYLGSYARDLGNITVGKENLANLEEVMNTNKSKGFRTLISRLFGFSFEDGIKNKTFRNKLDQGLWNIFDFAAMSDTMGNNATTKVVMSWRYGVKQVFYVLMFWLYVVLLPFWFVINKTFTLLIYGLADVGVDSYYKLAIDIEKTSDETFTRRNLEFLERLADEFVSRHGLGMALGTGLEKVVEFARLSRAGGTTLSNPYGIGHLNRYFALMMAWFYDYPLFECVEPFIPNYEPFRKRIYRLLENNYAAFKNLNMPKEMEKAYIKETKQLEQLFNRNKGKNVIYTPIIKFITGAMALPFRALFLNFDTASATMSKEMADLMDNADKVMDNKFFFQAARLRNLK